MKNQNENYSIFSCKACYKNKRFNGFFNGLCCRSIKNKNTKTYMTKH